MGCTPSILPPSAIVKTIEINTTSLTSDERLQLKEVWLLVKQNNLKKLADDIVNRALKESPTLKTYWQNATMIDYSDNLDFGEHDSCLNTDVIWKHAFRQHGAKFLEKIDQSIMFMTNSNLTSSDIDNQLRKQFGQMADLHSQHKISQDHVDILGQCLLESLKTLMNDNDKDWTVKHALTWTKFYSLMTDPFFTKKTPLQTQSLLW